MMAINNNKKIICLTGGVYSSIGKGIVLSSIGKILTELGYKVSVLKLDPYLNINSGLLSPNQHGEVFVTHDGEETDLDLGHYERFLDSEISKKSCYTAGKIYKRILEQEISGDISGRTIQVIPDVINAIHSVIFELMEAEKDSDFLIIEIGGTIGDIESIPFVTAAKHLVPIFKQENVLFIHMVPNIYLRNTNEYKTKPAQHSIIHLLTYGIVPDILILKSDTEVSEDIKEKISSTTSIPIENIISTVFQKSIYTVPNELYNNKIHEKILNHFSLPCPAKDLKNWEVFTNKIKEEKKHTLKICLVGKYAQSTDAYISILESFKFAALDHSVELDVSLLNSEEVVDESALEGFDLICVPYGFGTRGVEGKLLAIEYARVNKIPLLGICFGLQLICIEYARNVLGLKDANSIEIDSTTPHPVIILNKNMSSMRLGKLPVDIVDKTIAKDIFKSDTIQARHRHKYIFNQEYRSKFEGSDFSFSGFSDNILEIVELKNHPFFIGVQFHPEFDSKPFKTSPLFSRAIESALKKQKQLNGIHT